MPFLKKCILANIDKLRFEEPWNEMVSKFGLEDNIRGKWNYMRGGKCGPQPILGAIFLLG